MLNKIIDEYSLKNGVLDISHIVLYAASIFEVILLTQLLLQGTGTQVVFVKDLSTILIYPFEVLGNKAKTSGVSFGDTIVVALFVYGVFIMEILYMQKIAKLMKFTNLKDAYEKRNNYSIFDPFVRRFSFGKRYRAKNINSLLNLESGILQTTYTRLWKSNRKSVLRSVN